MSVLRFFVREYSGPGEWLLVSRLLLDDSGVGRRFSVECSGGRMWCFEFLVEGFGEVDDLVRRVRVGGSVGDLVDFFEGLGFGVVLPEDVVFF